jgi:hypothetical protein
MYLLSLVQAALAIMSSLALLVDSNNNSRTKQTRAMGIERKKNEAQLFGGR